LTDDSIAVPEGHYESDNMAVTVVPNRNAIMMTIAYGAAVADGADVVALAVHAGDHTVYPDCRPEFTEAFEHMERIATEGYSKPNLKTLSPFVKIGKHDIVKLGDDLGIDYSNTWSCYNGEETHCGTCGTCVERKEAFFLSGVDDPTEYLK